jgi:hypothetical protein
MGVSIAISLLALSRGQQLPGFSGGVQGASIHTYPGFCYGRLPYSDFAATAFIRDERRKQILEFFSMGSPGEILKTALRIHLYRTDT